MNPITAVIADLRATALTDRHFPSTCPCRKRHRLAPKPVAPPGPPNAGKRTKALRDVLEALHEARDTNDEANIAHLTNAAEFATGDLTEYRQLFETYLYAMSAWSSELCGNCAVSMMCLAAPGCPRCTSSDLEEMLGGAQ